MLPYQSRFLQLALQQQALRFGEFVLKSGRASPYFFNAGLFNTGAALDQLGQALAETLVRSGIEYDMLFGPAYKGISLTVATAIALARDFGRDAPVAFNRKEVKSHGEMGLVIGAPLQGRVVIVDDVITAGTSVRDSVALIRSHGARAAGVVIALDRQERGENQLAAAEEVRRQFDMPVVAIVSLEELLALTAEDAALIQHRAALLNYRKRYGVTGSGAH